MVNSIKGLLNRLTCGLLLVLSLSLAAQESGESEAADLAAELQMLEDVQAGIALAIAACEGEPHCVTALHEQEMQYLQDDLDALMTESDLSEDNPLQERQQALLENQQNLQQTVARVSTEVDRDTLEGAWSDQFVIDEIVVGPSVPYPNEDVPLSRFEDLNQPLPIQ